MGFRDEHETVSAFAALLQAHAFLVEELERELVSAKRLPLTWFEVLLRLSEARDGAMQMQELARSAWLSKSGMTRLIDRMHNAGLVERRACATDRRVTYAAITDAGRSVLDEAMPLHLEGVDRMVAGGLKREELRQLRTILEKILRANGQIMDPACDAATAPPAEAAS